MLLVDPLFQKRRGDALGVLVGVGDVAELDDDLAVFAGGNAADVLKARTAAPAAATSNFYAYEYLPLSAFGAACRRPVVTKPSAFRSRAPNHLRVGRRGMAAIRWDFQAQMKCGRSNLADSGRLAA